MQTVGVLRRILEETGWSQTRLATEASIDGPAMHKIMNGDLGLGRVRAERIVKAARRAGVDVSVTDLLHGKKRAELERLADQVEILRERVEQALADLDGEAQS